LRRYRIVGAGCLWLAGAFCLAASDALARSEALARAVDHCATQGPNPDGQAGRLSEDRSILCFDGPIEEKADLAPLVGLQHNGFFVVRSKGGYGSTAMPIADALYEKNVTVVIRDYCLSACANYFFVATKATYVLANAVIAWHGGDTDCANRDIAAAMSRLDQPCSHPYWARLSFDFFAKRGIDPRYTIIPQTRYSRRMVDTALASTLAKRNILWTWHPTNHRDHFKGRVTYESFPDEDAAYAAPRTLWPPINLIYDPEE
jgi:hypothetical protein